jgi:hypothetical protein
MPRRERLSLSTTTTPLLNSSPPPAPICPPLYELTSRKIVRVAAEHPQNATLPSNGSQTTSNDASAMKPIKHQSRMSFSP